ncbi:hypothetical protein B0A53_02222 [Rhodotorula sp. CCFEE 5036]|nr:hypothetical protein B0A53_02222 [Rhodotorula sp. CCFEE 5036]
MELEITGPVLKHFRSALTCLARLGQDLDFTCTEQRLSVSTVNSSRTAFGIVHFYPNFFSSYSPRDGEEKFRFSVNAKALLSTLRPRSANTVESCTLSVHDSDDRRNHHEPGVDSGECRIIVYLHCQHGVRKKHSLTYSQPALQSWARFDLNSAPCYWTASSRVLKDWMTHFHERAGSSSGGGGGGAGTDEVTFYCGRQECRLKSFNDVDRSGPTNDVFMTRALSTEVTVDTANFDTYHVPSPPSSSSSSSCASSGGVRVVTFAQKEFKAIINLAEPLQAPLTAHFSTGGRPIMFSLSANDPSRGGASPFEAKFVIATTDFDSGGSGGGGGGDDGIKREKSESVARQQRGRTGTDGRGAGGGKGGGAPLFNAPTPSPAPAPVPAPNGKGKGKGKGRARAADDGDGDEEEEEDEDFDAAFGDDADLDEAFFADLDRATQQAMMSQAQTQTQTRPTTRTTTGTTTTLASEKQRQPLSEEEEEGKGDVQLRSGVGKEFDGTAAAWSAPPAPAPWSADGGGGGGGDGRHGREDAEAHGDGNDPEPDTGGGVGVRGGGGGTGAELYGDDGGHDEFVWEDPAEEGGGGGGGETQLGPTQVIRDDDDGDEYGEGSGGSAADDSSGEGRRSVKRARWNLLGDG